MCCLIAHCGCTNSGRMFQSWKPMSQFGSHAHTSCQVFHNCMWKTRLCMYVGCFMASNRECWKKHVKLACVNCIVQHRQAHTINICMHALCIRARVHYNHKCSALYSSVWRKKLYIYVGSWTCKTCVAMLHWSQVKTHCMPLQSWSTKPLQSLPQCVGQQFTAGDSHASWPDND